jgi:hypothetical protein
LDAPDPPLMRARSFKPRPAALPAALVLIATALLVDGGVASAHLGSPDVFFEGNAGPYPLLVTIRPPEVIPGVAVVDVQAPDDQLGLVTLVPTPLRGPGAVLPPTADVAHAEVGDPHRFSAKLWFMASGSWQVRVHVDGPRGAGDLAVPVPALALRTKTMQRGLGLGLAALLAFLVAGMISIVGASVRDAALEPGQQADGQRRRRSRVAQTVAAAVLTALVLGGATWWGDEASGYGQNVYKPLALQASTAVGGDGVITLSLTLTDPGWAKSRRLDDLVPDHDHLMHLYVVRVPAMDVVAHLHPDQGQPGKFQRALPALPPGDYQLFADIVHQTGLAETATTIVTLPAAKGGGPIGDDALGTGRALAADAATTRAFRMPDGGQVVWLGGDSADPLRAGRTTWFRFRVDGADGKPATDVTPYMGMAGHAAFIKDDRSVFAHIHPSGSVSMATLALIESGNGSGVSADPHAAHKGHAGHHAAALPPEIAFPYACPKPGLYRIVVQFKRGDVIQTAFFSARVD